MNKNSQKGFTLMEMLSVLAIVLIVIGISVVSVNCVLASMNYNEAEVKGNELMVSLEGIYADTGKIPVKEKVMDIDKSVIEDVKKSIPSFDDMVSSGHVYKIDTDGLVIRGELTEEAISKFYVVYIKSDDVDFNKYRKYNLTVVHNEVCETCGGGTFSNIVGKSPYSNISNGLKFELEDKYIKCPNSALGFKLDDDDCK